MGAFLSKHLRFAVRLTILSGFVALTFALLYASYIGGPDWMVEPVFESCYRIGIGLAVVWLALELVMRVFRGNGMRGWMLVIALTSVKVPWLYVLPAALLARRIAELNTWHLIPLFAVMRMIGSIAILGTLGGIVVGLVVLVVQSCRPYNVVGLPPMSNG